MISKRGCMSGVILLNVAMANQPICHSFAVEKLWADITLSIIRSSSRVFKNIIKHYGDYRTGDEEESGGETVNKDVVFRQLSWKVFKFFSKKPTPASAIPYSDPLNPAYYICSGVWYEFKRLFRRRGPPGLSFCLPRHMSRMGNSVRCLAMPLANGLNWSEGGIKCLVCLLAAQQQGLNVVTSKSICI